MARLRRRGATVTIYNCRNGVTQVPPRGRLHVDEAEVVLQTEPAAPSTAREVISALRAVGYALALTRPKGRLRAGAE